MPGAIYLLLILLFLTMAVLTVTFYLQVRNGTPSRYDEDPPEPERDSRSRSDPSRVYFVKQPSARKTAQPKLQQVSPKNLFVLEQVDSRQDKMQE